MINSLIDVAKPQQKNFCVVRLKTSYWSDSKGVHKKKSLTYMKRKCRGYNILEDDCSNIGAEEVVPLITNLDSSSDGLYMVVTCNMARDWETGYVDAYEYKLISIPEDADIDSLQVS